MTRPELHLPVVSVLRDGTGWGAWCLACSERARDYVYPCQVMADRHPEDWPPARLVEP